MNYHPRTRVDFAATAPFIRAFPEEAVAQHTKFLEPTNPPDNSSKIEEVRKAAQATMAAREPLGAPNFVITTAPGSSLAAQPLELKAQVPADDAPKIAAPPPMVARFAVPAVSTATMVRPQPTHGVTQPPPRRPLYEPLPSDVAVAPLGTEHVVVIVGLGVALGLAWFLYSKWGAANVIEAASDASN